MTTEEKRRELFEVWWKAEGRHRKHQGIINGDEEIGFELWCAALDAVEIQLPIAEHYTDDKAYSAVADCRAAIEETGLGLKVKS